MISFTIEELEALGLEPLKKQQIEYQNKIYKKARLFPKKKIDLVEELCQEYSDKNLQTLTVEHKNLIFIWIEVKETVEASANAVKSSIVDSDATSDVRDDLFDAASSTPQKIIKSYRGVTYEVEVQNNLAVNSDSTTQKLRKYRGKYY